MVGDDQLSGGQSVQQESHSHETAIVRGGSIYDRLDRAREQRLKLLAADPANNDPIPMPAPRPPAPSKSHLLPVVKSQEAFDPPLKSQRLSPTLKLGIGLVAFAAMAGFTLTDWRVSGPVTAIKAPSAPAAQLTQDAQLPAPETVPRVAEKSTVTAPSSDTAPVVSIGPSESVFVDVLELAPRIAQPGANEPMADQILNVISDQAENP